MGFFTKNEQPEMPEESAELFAQEPSPENIITLSKPYSFEGVEYKQIDLSGVDDLTTKDLTEAERIFNRTGNFVTMPELNLQFIFLVAARATGKPIEFFSGLPITDALKIKNRMISLFFADGE